jgi:hypothetical protein
MVNDGCGKKQLWSKLLSHHLMKKNLRKPSYSLGPQKYKVGTLPTHDIAMFGVTIEATPNNKLCSASLLAL